MSAARRGAAGVAAAESAIRAEGRYVGARHAAPGHGGDHPTPSAPARAPNWPASDYAAAGTWATANVYRVTPPPGPAAGPASAGGQYPPRLVDEPYLPPPQVTAFELAMPDLRGQVASRLHQMSWKHAHQAWQRRRRDPIAPNALAFFFAEPPAGRPPRCELRTCIRLFLAADEPYLPRLLYEMTAVAAGHLADGGDPRVMLANSCEQMSAQAAYLGLGVSSLDTPAGSWEQHQRTASSDLDVPGRCWAVLHDGSRLVVDRLAKQDYGRLDIQSTHGLPRPSRRLDESASPGDADVWRWMWELHTVLWSGGAGAR